MSAGSVVVFPVAAVIGTATVVGIRATAALGELLQVSPAEAAARNARIRAHTTARRQAVAAQESQRDQAVHAWELRLERRAAARVDAAYAASALAQQGLPAEPALAQPAVSAPESVWDAWCDDVGRVLEGVFRRVSAARAATAARSLADLLPPVSAAALRTAADEIGQPEPLPGGGSDPSAAVVRILAGLDAMATAEGRARAEAAAADVWRRPDERRPRLRQVQLRVQEANKLARVRRADAVVAAELLDAMEPYAAQQDLDTGALHRARTGLVDVVSGRAELNDQLLNEVEQLRSEMEERALAIAVQDAVADALTELGYSVGTEFSVGQPSTGRLAVSRPDDADHLVRMKVDARARRIQSMVYRTGPGENPHADAAAEHRWCADLEQALNTLREAGLPCAHTELRPPGAEPTPRTAPRRRTEPRRRLRSREAEGDVR
ncbi:hypothetical protein [Micromonospora sp. NPDC005979]|uniref:hypothetical protein n=1 Tax=Micromonospora sp. NPDC005979 TaxID=3156726 RepID=UPI0033AA88DE